MVHRLNPFPNHFLKTVSTLLLLSALTAILVACGGTSAETNTELANPAAVNCEEQGGTSTIETREDGSQYGVCIFEDNMQCEEFALLNGDCPVGGVKVTGYVTDAGRFCAISGGTYAVTSEATDSEPEQGTCTFVDGNSCDAVAYYDGTCSP